MKRVANVVFAMSLVTANFAFADYKENQAKIQQLQAYEVKELNKLAAGKGPLASEATKLKTFIAMAIELCTLAGNKGADSAEEKKCGTKLDDVMKKKNDFETKMATGGGASVNAPKKVPAKPKK